MCVWRGGTWVQLLGGQRTHTLIILVLHEYIWNSSTVSLVLPVFDEKGVTASCSPVGNREDELKLTTFSSLLFACVFLSFLLLLSSSDVVPLSDVCWGYSLIIIIIILVARLGKLIAHARKLIFVPY